MRVDDTGDFGSRFMDGAMYYVASLVDAVLQVAKVRGRQDIAVEIYLDEAGRSDFFVHHPIRVDQESLFVARYTHRNMIGDHVRHAVHLHQPIAGGEIDPCLPFFWRTPGFHRADV